jgi:hypothetical protein
MNQPGKGEGKEKRKPGKSQTGKSEAAELGVGNDAMKLQTQPARTAIPRSAKAARRALANGTAAA